ncbi:hypothetical protein BJ875DRAFT_292121 [Amylocarpus encephaloides]|uniref:DUF8004 domain-containing protein n=1 Tax=Amylocarpus encephaloides TaxID=45428 RepID=A0A9P7YJS4_9HELO|nr:hypothetical protein BJ875DRAFT_292121 [Amylocarpus encephaloides]
MTTPRLLSPASSEKAWPERNTHTEEGQESFPRREFPLYKGVTARPLGWKRGWKGASRVPQLASTARDMKIRKWDGAARMSTEWDGLRRDPDLWYGAGDCLVHLYGKGHSRRAPTFKVPIANLTAVNASPLLKRFLVERIDPGPSRDGPSHHELYIPPPTSAERGQVFLYHIATRNFFAWVFGKSLVGSHLGGALVGLLNSMNGFRSNGENHVRALLDYIGEEGYDDMRNSPDHALGILFFAEHFRFKDMWIDAFAHCVGMNERLIASPGFEYMSRTSRAMVTRARYEMDLRLDVCGQRVGTFLTDELSNAHLGLPPAARAHLDTFRSFLQTYYVAKLGYYPPSIEGGRGAFPPSILKQMASEFQTLFDFLVDTSLTSSDPTPLDHQGGLCVLQNVQSFDQRFKHHAQHHPQPLLPNPEDGHSPKSAIRKRFSWAKRNQTAPDRRLATYAALSKATNRRNSSPDEGTLVRAYRGFEKDTVFSPNQAEKHDQLSHADARKVRWILIYSVLQTLLSATKVPDQVRDTQNVGYHLCVFTTGAPPWNDDRPLETLLRTQTDWTRMDDERTRRTAEETEQTPITRVEIKPDLDWNPITHRSSYARARSKHTGITLSKHGFVRRASSSLSNTAELQHPRPNRISYHEILVHGYGNGTNHVHISTERLPTLAPSAEPAREASSDSHASSTAGLSSRGSHPSDEEGGNHESLSPPSSVSQSRRASPASIDETKTPIRAFLDHHRGGNALGMARVPSSASPASSYDGDDDDPPVIGPEPLQLRKTLIPVYGRSI